MKASIEAPTPWLFARSYGTRWQPMESFKTADDVIAERDRKAHESDVQHTGVEYVVRYLDHEADLFARRQLEGINRQMAKTTPVHPG